jgi:hypothetical protein
MEVPLLSLDKVVDCADTLRSSVEDVAGIADIVKGDSASVALVPGLVSIPMNGESEELLDSGSLLTVVRVVPEVNVPVLLVVGSERVGASPYLGLGVGSSFGTSLSLLSSFLDSGAALLEL